MTGDESGATPRLPGTEYRVHDPSRPKPPSVDPGRGPAAGSPVGPPSDATVLFDGTDLDGWEGIDGDDADWLVEDGYVEVVPGTGDSRTVEAYGDGQFHVEWATPAPAEGDGQQRGNSGVFLMDRYEIQVLDCYENVTYADGYAAAVYGQHPPLVNACCEPGAWQTFDVLWRGPRFEAAELRRPARVTVLHNGVVVHDRTELVGPTAHGRVQTYTPHPPVGPLRLQDHGDRVRFRNIWFRPLPE